MCNSWQREGKIYIQVCEIKTDFLLSYLLEPWGPGLSIFSSGSYVRESQQ